MAPIPPKMLVLYGPPGTGKTFRAARESVQIIDGKFDEKTVVARHSALVQAGRIWWVTFHPNYSYEDFVEGLRPTLTDENQVIYLPKDGPFKKACEACYVKVPTALLQVGERLGDRGNYEVIHVEPGGVVLQSEVTRKDAVVSKIEQYVDFWTIQKLKQAGLEPDWLAIPGADNERKQEFARRSGLPTTLLANSGPYRAVYKYLEQKEVEFVTQPVVLVIDEINRADLSRIFGELLTLIEPDKREGAAEERRIFLPYSQRLFTVPENLSIVATMNTADRSLSVFDVALRRRFEFMPEDPKPELCPADYGGLSVRHLLETWNHRISALLSRDNRIGHADLMHDKLETVRVAHGWPNDSDGRCRAFAWVVRQRILPLLLDYFRDDWRKADVVFGRNSFTGQGGLLELITFTDVAELTSEILDLSDSTTFEAPKWWDPMSAEWSAEKLRQALGAAGSAGPNGASSAAVAK